MSLSELRTKDVVNTLDGKRLGKVMDLEFDARDGRGNSAWAICCGEKNAES